jgi:alpha-tubulin suppressor-like RCC1 family protein
MIRENPEQGLTWCIGNNDYGQLGDGTCTDRGNWVIFQLPAGEYGSLNMNPESGYQMNSFMVITQTGRVFAAGDNTRGKLGTNTSMVACNGTPRELVLPYRPGSITERVKAVAIANNDEYTSFVLGDDGRVYSAGDNSNGQLGVDSSIANTSSPLLVKIPRVSVSF